MSVGSLIGGAAALALGCYGLYRIGVWLERRHLERCYICAAQLDIRPRRWEASSVYWDSAENRWAHTNCQIERVHEMRKAGLL